MCSAVCQQSHSRVPARTDQSRSVTGNRPLITHEIAASRSLAVTVMVVRAYDHKPPGMSGSPLVTPIEPFWSGLSGTSHGDVAAGVSCRTRRGGGPRTEGRPHWVRLGPWR